MSHTVQPMNFALPPALVRTLLPRLHARWWLGFGVMLAFLLNEAIGSVPLYLALLVVGAWSVTRARRSLRALAAAGTIPWLVPFFALLSTAWAADPAVTARLSLELIMTVGMALLIADSLDPDELIFAAFAATGIICVLSLAVHHVAYDGMTGRTNWSGIYANKNSLCSCAATLALCSIAIVVNERYGRLVRAGALVGIVFGLAMAVLARAVASIAACGVAMICFALLYLAHFMPRRQRPAYFELAITILVLGSLAVGALILSNADFVLGLVGKDATLTGRTLLWSYAARFAQDHPLLGVGYQDFWVQGHSTAEFLWAAFHIESRGGFHFHSTYYSVLTELGYAGVALGAVFSLATITRAMRWARSAVSPGSLFFFVYVIYMGISALQGPVLFTYFDLQFALVVAGLATASQRVRRFKPQA